MTTAKPRPPPAPGETRAYPVLPLRDIVVFPHMIVPAFRRTQEIDPGARGGDAVRHLHPARHPEERVRRRSGNGGDLRGWHACERAAAASPVAPPSSRGWCAPSRCDTDVETVFSDLGHIGGHDPVAALGHHRDLGATPSGVMPSSSKPTPSGREITLSCRDAPSTPSTSDARSRARPDSSNWPPGSSEIAPPPCLEQADDMPFTRSAASPGGAACPSRAHGCCEIRHRGPDYDPPP